MESTISIVIPTKLVDPPFLVRCLTSIKKFSSLVSAEIILVASEVDQTLVDLVKSSGLPLPHFSYVRGDNVPGELNKILLTTSSSFVILLHDDVELLPQNIDSWIERLIQPFRDQSVVATGPHRIRNPDYRFDYLDPFCVMFSVERWRKAGRSFLMTTPRHFLIEWCDGIQSSGHRIFGVAACNVQHGTVTGPFPIYHAGGHTFNRRHDNAPSDYMEHTRIKQVISHRIISDSARYAERSSVLFEKGPSSISDNVLSNVVATISTKNRTRTTLPLAINSVASQTKVPGCLAIFYDNSESFDFSQEPFSSIFAILAARGCHIIVYAGGLKGQVFNHQMALEAFVDFDFVWRLDDDNVADPCVLSSLTSLLLSRPNVAAAASAVYSPHFEAPIESGRCSTKIEDVAVCLNIQWTRPRSDSESPTLVEHLYSTFVYRRSAALGVGYSSQLSQVGHREETMFTHALFQKGHTLLVDRSVITWHLSASHGGIRSPEFSDSRMWSEDDRVFNRFMSDLGKMVYTDIRIITLDAGVGDHLAFLSAWPTIYRNHISRNPTTKILIGACYPDALTLEHDGERRIFGIPSDQATLISISEAHHLLGEKQQRVDNVYEWMDQMHWSGTLVQAFEAFYG